MLEITAIAILIIALAAGALLWRAARRPDLFEIQRTARIEAAPERIFPHIDSLKSMNAWNPFVEPDPAIRIAYLGPERGRGAAHTWVGNRHVGEGRIEIVDSEAPSRVTMKLDMVKPMKAANTVRFTLRPAGSGTDVTWAMSGRQPLMAKLMTLFIDCDRMVGSQFEKGLGRLKSIVETAPVFS